MPVMSAVRSRSPENLPDLASLHPDVWRGNQLARWSRRTVETGFSTLSAELPGGGWPLGSLTELMVEHPGVGEVRLLRPALHDLARPKVALIAPPHAPQGLAWLEWGLDPSRVVWIRAQKTADALWAAEQALRNGSCGAVLFWRDSVRPEALRRLHLAAQSSEALFVLFRPMPAGQDFSPAPLRLALTAHPGGVRVSILKRPGGVCERPIDLELDPPRARARRQDASPTVERATAKILDFNAFSSPPDTPLSTESTLDAHRPDRHVALDRTSSPFTAARRAPADVDG
ncbi:cell division inhibitor [Burkholderia pseudomallei]|nr:translesion DNA synthesis-associated protein ImuA [Burkholderia pseudomallei]CAJ3067980.1 cell division inhibitor [Burkholderia pseudomallei]VCK73121.1 cell division inhibitor [Burkholderia pseudomallei]VCK79826.1 cell division inhibitor [Burkholderia pseudomallei]VCK80202.1 cell division inhibitor [Burkholderia pseudomallei]VCK80981.1 cell division inhibitor [Burkholderia pseudomallei]